MDIELEERFDGDSLVKLGDNILFRCRSKAHKGSIEVAKHFYQMRPDHTTRKVQSRMIANFFGDFKKYAVNRGVFPDILNLGFEAYSDLRKLFEERYGEKIKVPKRIKPRRYGNLEYHMPRGRASLHFF